MRGSCFICSNGWI